MNPKILISGIVLVVALIVLMGSIFVVEEREKAILVRLGEIVETKFDKGIHFKTPFVNNVVKFDARILTLDISRERFLTSEKKNVIVDAYVKWRIADSGRYYTSTSGDARRASLRLSETVKDGLRSEFGQRTIQEVISGERSEIVTIIVAQSAEQAKSLGVEIVDIRVTRIDLPPEVSNSVFRRMRAERNRVAEEFRSRGSAEAIRIRARADRERTVVLAEAKRDSEQIRGDGDAKATEIYANAFSKDEEFYKLSRSLDAYKNTFSSPNDLIVLQPDSEFFRYFKNSSGK